MSGEFVFGLIVLGALGAMHYHEQTYGKTDDAALKRLRKLRDAVHEALQGSHRDTFLSAVYQLEDAYRAELGKRTIPEQREHFLRFLALHGFDHHQVEMLSAYVGPGGFELLKSERGLPT